MVLRWIEGFENRGHTNYFQRIYASNSGIAVGSDEQQAGRRVGFSLFAANQTFTTRAIVSAVEETWVVQFAYKKESASNLNTEGPGIALNTDAGNQLALLQIAPAAPNVGMLQFELRRGATVLATTPLLHVGIGPKAWHCFQLKARIHQTLGTYELRHWDYDNNMTVLIAPATSQNTADQGTDGADRVVYSTGGTGGPRHFLDDIVVWDDTGSGLTDFTTNPLIVHGALPGSDGNQTDFLPSSGSDHFELLNDIRLGDGSETTEVTSDTLNDIELLQPGDFLGLASTVEATIHGVMVDVEAAMKNTGARTLRIRVRESALEANDTTDMIYNNTAKESQWAILPQNPTGTPAAWTKTTLNAAEIGFQLTA